MCGEMFGTIVELNRACTHWVARHYLDATLQVADGSLGCRTGFSRAQVTEMTDSKCP